MILAGLLYIGSGTGLLLYLGLFSFSRPDNSRNESALKKTDIPWLSGVVICGGFLAPFTLMISLQFLACLCSPPPQLRGGDDHRSCRTCFP